MPGRYVVTKRTSKLPPDIRTTYNRIFKNKEIDTVKPGSRSMKLGHMVNFVYDAKWKHKLDYWDALPMAVVLHKYGDRFLGLNLHYIPSWTMRIHISRKLLQATKGKNRINYGKIKQAWRQLKLPIAWLYLCIRMYLYSHIRSEMRIFTFYQYQDAIKDIPNKFRKQAEKQVLQDIRRKWKEHQEREKSRAKK